MAFLVSETKIKGTFDGVSFYPSIFGWLVRMKGGPTRDQVKKGKAFARTRESASEFGSCSAAASIARKAVTDLTGVPDKSLYHQLISLMVHIMKEDGGAIRGKRTPEGGLASESGLRLLQEFCSMVNVRLDDVLEKTGWANKAYRSASQRRRLRRPMPRLRYRFIYPENSIRHRHGDWPYRCKKLVQRE